MENNFKFFMLALILLALVTYAFKEGFHFGTQSYLLMAIALGVGYIISNQPTPNASN